MISILTTSTIPAARSSSRRRACLQLRSVLNGLVAVSKVYTSGNRSQLARGGSSVKVTATPARHGPAGIEPLAGDVIGFVLEDGLNNIYVTGDTVWYDGVAEVARGFKAKSSYCLRARRRRVAPFISQWIQTMPSKPRRLFLTAVIVPVHYEGWAHFKQNGDDLLKAFNT